jgi:hypothetical protein
VEACPDSTRGPALYTRRANQRPGRFHASFALAVAATGIALSTVFENPVLKMVALSLWATIRL